MSDPDEISWEKFVQENPTFTGAYYKAWQMLPSLFLATPAPESDPAGMVVLQLMMASVSDFDDIMLLSSTNSHFGALKLLRCAFERAITLKYIAQNPKEAEAFVEFDALDWQRILVGIEAKSGLRMSETSQKNLDNAADRARKKFRQEPCEKCGLRKQTTWTPQSARDLAKRVGLDYMFFDAFELPSKFIHPTYWGTHEAAKRAPMHNTLKHAHELLLEIILVHHRYFHGQTQISQSVEDVIQNFFSIWKYAETDFGLPDRLRRIAL
ncbi:MAG: DUF5677 domain-containing protein [Terriglobales bacterium]